MTDRVLVVCDDLFFWARIHGTASALGRAASRIADEAGMEAALQEGGVRRVIVDLGAGWLDLAEWVPRWKSLAQPPELVAFGSHVDVEAHERARRAGFDHVLAKSRFVRDLASFL